MSQFERQNRSPQFFGGSPRITWAVQRLILLNGAIFAAWLLLAPLEAWLRVRQGVGVLDWLMFQPSGFLSGRVWEVVTYCFLHGGLWHLTVNMLTLFFFGPEVERELGTPQFFRFYIFCGIVSVLATIPPYVIYGRDAHVLGASGAVMGVLAAFVYLDPQRQVYLFPLPAPITALWMMIGIVAINIISSLQGSSISVETHVGGMAAGYVYMKFAPQWLRAWRRRKFRVVPKPSPQPEAKSPAEWDKVGRMVNEILKDKERDFDERP